MLKTATFMGQSQSKRYILKCDFKYEKILVLRVMVTKSPIFTLNRNSSTLVFLLISRVYVIVTLLTRDYLVFFRVMNQSFAEFAATEQQRMDNLAQVLKYSLKCFVKHFCKILRRQARIVDTNFTSSVLPFRALE